METTEEKKKTVNLIKSWEDWDADDDKVTNSEGKKLCLIEDPDCEACQ
ncbi:MAG: hypothetical protein WCG80_12295 [Spirochaetales bacterium]